MDALGVVVLDVFPEQPSQMIFPEDASFLVLGRNSRAQPVYEADVVRIPPLRK